MDAADLQRELAELEALANAMLKRIAKLRAGHKPPAEVRLRPTLEDFEELRRRRAARAARAATKRFRG